VLIIGESLFLWCTGAGEYMRLAALLASLCT
jgi:hypothetical protein